MGFTIREGSSGDQGAGKPKKWIGGMHLKKGALHKQMGVPEGEKIPVAKLKAAAAKGGTLGKRARLAMAFRGMKKG